MALVTVDDDTNGDFRSKPRWSAGRKVDVVMRLLRGERLETLSRELGVEAHRLAAWRDEFLEAGKEGLKGKRATTEDDRRLREAERKIGELTMENEIWQAVAPKKGAPDAVSEAAEVSAEMDIGLATVCRVTGAPRSTVYYRRWRGDQLHIRPGPKTAVSDAELTELIREVITTCPFAGEGHRKVRARLRRDHGIWVGKHRVLRLMRKAGLLVPQRARRRRSPRPHDGRITTDAPNVRWGTDGTMAWTRTDGWVWVFVNVDHHTDEAWTHVAKIGNRFAALQPVYSAVIDRFGALGPDVARGIKLHHDWGSQYRAAHFLGSIARLGIQDDAAYVGEPECNGVAERFIRTLKEQCLWSDFYEDVDELRQAVGSLRLSPDLLK
jgi:transposase InsO family protein